MQLEQVGDGPKIREIAPAACPNGHPLRPPNVQIFWGSPADGEPPRRGWRCWTCEAITWDEG